MTPTTYLQFLLPGILAQTIATGAIAIGVNLNTDLEKGIFDRFKSLPIPRSSPLVGAVLGDVVRYVIVTSSTLGIGYLMGFRILTDPLSALAGCLLAVVFALSLSWVSVFVGMKVRTSGAVQGIMFLIIMPLSFASNVFVPATTLPSWMQTFVEWNPLTHLVAAMRGLLPRHADGRQRRTGRCVVRRPGRGVPAAGHAGVPPQGLTTTAPAGGDRPQPASAVSSRTRAAACAGRCACHRREQRPRTVPSPTGSAFDPPRPSWK